MDPIADKLILDRAIRFADTLSTSLRNGNLDGPHRWWPRLANGSTTVLTGPQTAVLFASCDFRKPMCLPHVCADRTWLLIVRCEPNGGACH